MIIDEKLLKAQGAQLLALEKDEYLVKKETYPQNYYQVKSGSFKITTDNDDKIEFIHQLPGKGEPVGETFLFFENLYEINAIALNDSIVYVLERIKFHQLLEKNPAILLKLYQYACESIQHQRILMYKVAYSDPANKIITVLDHIKKLQNQLVPFQYEVPYTRKQLASLTGLRTETVVRTIKLMEKQEMVKIVNGKVFY